MKASSGSGALWMQHLGRSWGVRAAEKTLTLWLEWQHGKDLLLLCGQGENSPWLCRDSQWSIQLHRVNLRNKIWSCMYGRHWECWNLCELNTLWVPKVKRQRCFSCKCAADAEVRIVINIIFCKWPKYSRCLTKIQINFKIWQV